MNNFKLISQILTEMTKRIINEEAITISYFLLFLSENDKAIAYINNQIKNSDTYEDFRMFFHKHLRQTSAFDSTYLEMTLHGFLNINISLFEDALKFIYWLNKNYPEIEDINKAIDTYYFDYDLGDD